MRKPLKDPSSNLTTVRAWDYLVVRTSLRPDPSQASLRARRRGVRDSHSRFVPLYAPRTAGRTGIAAEGVERERERCDEVCGGLGVSEAMAENKEESVGESVMEKIMEKLHHDDSSSSDSDNEKSKPSSSSVQSQIYRLFGREKPIHTVLGGGKPADIFLWRNKKISAGMLGGATAIWVLFELMEYHLLGLVCHCLILSLAILFLWSNASTVINKSPPRIPEVSIPEDVAVNLALSLRYEINRGFAVLRDIASGRDLKKFLMVIAGLWVLSIIGCCCNFLTLFYIVFVTLHTVPVLYEKYEDKVDSFAEKAMIEVKKHCGTFHAKCLSKIPRGPLKEKKHQ